MCQIGFCDQGKVKLNIDGFCICLKLGTCHILQYVFLICFLNFVFEGFCGVVSVGCLSQSLILASCLSFVQHLFTPFCVQKNASTQLFRLTRQFLSLSKNRTHYKLFHYIFYGNLTSYVKQILVTFLKFESHITAYYNKKYSQTHMNQLLYIKFRYKL